VRFLNCGSTTNCPGAARRNAVSVGDPPKSSEVYIECKLRGGLLQVSAIDAATATEVSVFGPVNARAALIHNATAKLAFMLKKKKT